jgi:hypothetical protein
VSSHGKRSVHAQKRDQLKATSVSHGTTFELGSIFTPDPAPGNPPKCYSVESVQKNYLTFLFVWRKVEMFVLPAGSAAFIPAQKCGGLSPRFGKGAWEKYGNNNRYQICNWGLLA